MRHWLIVALLAAPLPAMAQTGPSFDCARAQTPTEIMVCKMDTLAQLDQTMADLFFAEFAFLESRRPDDARAFRAEQLLWQRWRNTCSDDPDCLTRRYRARILDFNPFFTFDTGFAPDADAPSRTRLNDGRFETLNADGTIDFTSIDGRYQGTMFPSGVFQAAPIAIEIGPGGPIELPPLPPAADDPWLLDLEERLLLVVDTMLPPSDHDGYRSLHTNFPTPTRVERHITSIGILSQ